MARISTTEANQALATTNWAFLSLHTADPTTTGANEVLGTGYARVPISWATPSGGFVSNSSSLSINLPANTTVTYFGVWSALTSGTYYLGGTLSPSVSTSSNAGIVTIASAGITVTAS